MGEKRGLFVVLEGGDYCGKRTQAVRLCDYITELSEDNDVLITHEPTWRAAEIKRKLKEDKSAYGDGLEMARLYVDEDRVPHTRDIIEPALSNGVSVIGNRYMLSTLAYQWAQGVDLGELLEMQRNKGILIPDLTVILDLDDESPKKRMAYVGEPDKFERDFDFRSKVYRNYRELFHLSINEETYGNLHLVNGADGIDIVAEIVKDSFNSVYGSQGKKQTFK